MQKCDILGMFCSIHDTSLVGLTDYNIIGERAKRVRRYYVGVNNGNLRYV